MANTFVRNFSSTKGPQPMVQKGYWILFPNFDLAVTSHLTNLMKCYLYCALATIILLAACSSQDKFNYTSPSTQSSWPDSIPWWKANNLRVIQANLPAYEAALNADSLVDDLANFSANTLIINAGGIMAFYPTNLECQYTNPHMKPNMLGDVIQKCHQKGIRVIVRFDFSRAHKSIFEKHPDWFYLSPAGDRIINDDMYAVSMNGPYEQECLYKIVGEVIDLYPVDGIFINMPGYQTRNAYLGVYHGIDQNEHEKRRFSEFSNGMNLPLKEDANDPVFRKYEEFKAHTTDGLMRRLHALVKSKNEQIAICTYSDKFVDIIRHESQTNTLPYWPYNASDNVSNAGNSFPGHIVSNASIQQISFQSRYNAIEPEEITIRLYENIANGSGLDLSLMGDFQDYEDERNYPAIKKIYDHHKKFEPYFGRYRSPAKVVVIAPGAWPAGEAAQEYRGIQLMLKEAHIQFDIIEHSQIGELRRTFDKYKLIILPEIPELREKDIEVLKYALGNGTHLIATNRSLSRHPDVLEELFGAKSVKTDHDGAGFYLQPDNKKIFKRFTKQALLFWKFNLGLFDFSRADTTFLPVYTPGRPGPPEIIGGHERSGYFAAGMKNHANATALLMPINLGKLYYLHGYEQHKNILLDMIDHVAPETKDLVVTDAHERVEVIVQQFVKNIPANMGRTDPEGMIVHLVNLTGFSGNTYFHPLPVRDIAFQVACASRPASVSSMIKGNSVDFNWRSGTLHFTLNELNEYDGILIEFRQ